MSAAAHPNPSPFDPASPVSAPARRATLPPLRAFIDTKPGAASAPPRDSQAELEPHWLALVDAATD